MGLWEFLIAVVTIEAIVKLVKIKSATRADRQSRELDHNALLERMDKLERRMANLETIVLESEKHRQFDRAL